MGNYRFKLADMIPNSWVYKLKHMSIRRRNHKKEPPTSPTQQPQPVLLHSRFTGGNSPAEPPRKSSRGKPRRRAAARSSPKLVITSSSGCSCGSIQSVTVGPPLPPPSPPELGTEPPLLTRHSFHADDNATANSAKRINGSDRELKSLAQIDLPPIITRSSLSSSKPEETDATKDKSFAKELRRNPSRQFPVSSPRVSSKRFGHLGRRKSGSLSAAAKRSLTNSLAIVKSTNDPQRDFRESAMEMIVENKIGKSNEFEDLLACYLSLNADEYHDIIIKVFKQIWFDMSDI